MFKKKEVLNGTIVDHSCPRHQYHTPTDKASSLYFYSPYQPSFIGISLVSPLIFDGEVRTPT